MHEKQYQYDQRIAAIHSLRVNVKSLAHEAKLIRSESKRCGPIYRQRMDNHRRYHLREEARYAQLALAFARQRPYKSVEGAQSKLVNPDKLCAKIVKHWLFANLMERRDRVCDWLAT